MAVRAEEATSEGRHLAGQCGETGRVLYVKFSTESGFYIYDAFSNQILEVSASTWSLIEDILGPDGTVRVPADSHGISQDDVGDAVTQIAGGIDAGYLRPCAVESMRFYSDETELLRSIRTRIRQLSLEVTAGCNFRCQYCRYTYDPGERFNSHRRMSWETALNAIAVFLAHSEAAPSRAITFWGGEPLLEFSLIQRVIDHVESHHADRKIVFSFTTNGSLITPEIATFLAKHRVHLLVSLDGPRQVHDRFRVDAHGKGTFDRVVRGLRCIMEADPSYYSKCVAFNCVLTPGTDLEDVFAFFNEDALCRGDRLTLVRASGAGTPFYERNGRFTSEQERFLRSLHLGALISARRDTVAGRALMKDQRLLSLARRPRAAIGSVVSPNGCCVPLLKRMLVDPEGSVHICQEVAADNAVGNVNHGGIDFDEVLQIVGEYTQHSVVDCHRCWAVRLCFACFRNFIRQRRWAPGNRDELCSAIRRSQLEALQEYASLIEADSDAPAFWRDVTIEYPV